jgi:hypothetical protein
MLKEFIEHLRGMCGFKETVCAHAESGLHLEGTYTNKREILLICVRLLQQAKTFRTVAIDVSLHLELHDERLVPTFRLYAQGGAVAVSSFLTNYFSQINSGPQETGEISLPPSGIGGVRADGSGVGKHGRPVGAALAGAR